MHKCRLLKAVRQFFENSLGLNLSVTWRKMEITHFARVTRKLLALICGLFLACLLHYLYTHAW